MSARRRERSSAAEVALRLWNDEEGASLVFAAITLFSLALCVLYVYQMGVASANRMTVQNAADAGAYSAAQVEANALNAVGQVNDAMAYLNYLMLRHTVDAIVYDTIHAFETKGSPPARGNLAYVQMGGPDGKYEGPERYAHVRRFVNTSYARGQEWMADLHAAGRAIVRATPALVRRTAVEVAAANGAAKVAVSSDLERAFRVGDAASDGFGEGSSSAERFEPALYQRYAEREVQEVIDAGVDTTRAAKRRLPVGWFDPARGRQLGPYFQVRLCWNAKDWEHAGHTSPHGTYFPFNLFRDGSPNGHWHREHYHFKLTPLGPLPLGPHGGGGSNGQPMSDRPGGHYLPGDDDPSLHQDADDLKLMGSFGSHHYFVVCPTCRARRFAPGARWSEVARTSDEASTLRPYFRLRYTPWPRPLMLRASLLRSGVTVAAWSPGGGLGDTFPGTDWGVLALATAQVGYQTDEGVLPLKEVQGGRGQYFETRGAGALVPGQQEVPVLAGGPVDPRNFFYSADSALGVRFGARLVPIASPLAHHPDLGYRSVAELLDPASTRWYDEGSPDAAGTPPPGLDALRDVVEVNSESALEAFWH